LVSRKFILFATTNKEKLQTNNKNYFLEKMEKAVETFEAIARESDGGGLRLRRRRLPEMAAGSATAETVAIATAAAAAAAAPTTTEVAGVRDSGLGEGRGEMNRGKAGFATREKGRGKAAAELMAGNARRRRGG
jgi:hypothetical protein